MKNIKKCLLFMLLIVLLLLSLNASVICGENVITSENPIRLTMQVMETAAMLDFRLHEKFAESVEKASGGRIIINVLPLGSVCKYNDTFNAVRDGVIDLAPWTPAAGLGILGPSAYIIGAAGVPGGMRAEEFMGWTFAGGGHELIKEVVEEYGITFVGLNTISLTEVFCHSHKKLTSLEDFKGLRFRTMGMWGGILKTLGASVVNISVDELYSAAERKIIDAFEYVGPMQNYILGFHEVAKYVGLPGIHSPMSGEILIMNNQAANEMPDDLMEILFQCSKAAVIDSIYQHTLEDAKGLRLLEEAGAEIFYLPEDVQQKFLEVSAEMHREWMEEDPMYKEIFMSQKKFHDERTFHQDNVVPKLSIYDLF